MKIDAVELRGVVAAMATYPRTWAIAGGWALDLFIGQASRPHTDIDVAVCRSDQRTLRRYLEAFDVWKVADGQLAEWTRDEWLPMPIHEIHARSSALAFELLFNECDGSQWVYRRDARIQCKLTDAIYDQSSVPFLAPEIVLLYKAKAPSAIDQSDFMRVVRHLAPHQRQWLSDALQLSHPGHPWLGILAAEA